MQLLRIELNLDDVAEVSAIFIAVNHDEVNCV